MSFAVRQDILSYAHSGNDQKFKDAINQLFGSDTEGKIYLFLREISVFFIDKCVFCVYDLMCMI